MSAPQTADYGIWPLLGRCPVVLAWVLLALLALPVSLEVAGWATPWLGKLWMVDARHAYMTPLDGLFAGLRAGEWWRLVTPAFLHFSLMHIAFNAVLFVVLGMRLELRLGSGWLLLVLVLWAVSSNLAQLLASSNAAFGGLSGVVAAMFGALVVLGYLRPQDPLYKLPQGFVPGMLVSLIVFSTGITELFGLHVANAAHWAGVAGGVVVGGLLHLLLRFPRLPEPPSAQQDQP